jgi:hypothetical protein
MATNRWMQKAATSMKKKGTEGSFTRAAKRAGYGTQEYAHMKEHAPGKLGKRARMALRFAAAKH